MPNKILHQSNTVDPWFIIAGRFFLQNGMSGSYEGWEFPTFSDYVRNLANGLNTDSKIDFKQKSNDSYLVPFEQVIRFLEDLFSQGDAIAASVPLQSLLQELEEQEEEIRKKTKEQKQQAITQTTAIIEAFEKRQEILRENSKTVNGIIGMSAEKLTVSPISEELTPEDRTQLALSVLQIFNRNIQSSGLVIQIEKLKDLPEENRQVLESDIGEKWTEQWEQSVVAAEDVLKHKGIVLSLKQKEYLHEIRFPLLAADEYASLVSFIPGNIEADIGVLLAKKEPQIPPAEIENIVLEVLNRFDQFEPDLEKSFGQDWQQAVEAVKKENPADSAKYDLLLNTSFVAEVAQIILDSPVSASAGKIIEETIKTQSAPVSEFISAAVVTDDQAKNLAAAVLKQLSQTAADPGKNFDQSWQEAVKAAKKEDPQNSDKYDLLLAPAQSTEVRREISLAFHTAPQNSETKTDIQNTLTAATFQGTKEEIGQLTDNVFFYLAQTAADPGKNFDQSWKQAVESAKKDDPKNSIKYDVFLKLSADIPVEQKEAIAGHIAESGKLIDGQKKIIQSIIDPPLSKNKNKIVEESFYRTFFSVLPVADITPEQFQKLSGEEQKHFVQQFTKQIEDSTIISLAIISEPGNPDIQFSGREVTGIVTKLTSLNENEFISLLKVANTAPSNRSFIIENGLPVLLKPTDTAIIPETSPNPSLFGNNQLFRLNNNTVALLAGELKPLITSRGINDQSLSEIKEKTTSYQVIVLTLQGIKTTDLDNTRKVLIQKGFDPGSKQIREINQLIAALAKFQQSDASPEFILWVKQHQVLRETLIKKGKSSPVFIPFTKDFKGPIEEVLKPNRIDRIRNAFTKQADSFVVKFFRSSSGKKLAKIVLKTDVQVQKAFSVFKPVYLFVASPKLYVINKISYFRAKAVNKISAWFWNTGAGKGIKIGIEKVAKKNLQEVFKNFSKKAIKEAVTKIAAKAVTQLALKLGIKVAAQAVANTIAPVIGFIVVEAGSFLLKKIYQGSKKVIRGLNTLGGMIDGVFEGLAGKQLPTDPDEKFFGFLLIGAAIVIFVLPIIGISSQGGAFISPSKYSGVGGTDLPPDVPMPPNPNSTINCTSPRHFSEEVICKLSNYSYPCNQKRVNQGSLPTVLSCIQSPSSNFSSTAKQKLSSAIQASVSSYGSFQCIAFPLVIQDLLGQDFSMSKPCACNYAHPPVPSGYELLQNFLSSDSNYFIEPKNGDIAIWDKPGCTSVTCGRAGHAAIVLAKNGNVKISVAHANYDLNGLIDVNDFPIKASEGGPSYYLRKK